MRREVRAHALHGIGADRFDPRLLDGLEDRAGRLALGAVLGCGSSSVIGVAQGIGVGDAADDRDFLAG